MNPAREAFLERVRAAIKAGNQSGTPPLPARGTVGYQGAGPDPAAHFFELLTRAGGQPHPVADDGAAVTHVLELVARHRAQKILLGGGPVLDRLKLFPRLRDAGCDVVRADKLDEDRAREPMFAAELGISGVDYLLAETGSLVLLARPGEPRSVSLLPPVHVAVADRSQLVADLFDVFDTHLKPALPKLPSCVTLVTGPSKTGDIELRLVTGVHGPGVVHVVLIG